VGAGIVGGAEASVHVGQQHAPTVDIDTLHASGTKFIDLAYFDKTVWHKSSFIISWKIFPPSPLPRVISVPHHGMTNNSDLPPESIAMAME
jgi:hypothetical protein